MLLIRNATVVNEGKSFRGGVLVDGERIAEIFSADEIPESVLLNSRVIDADGCLLLPGAIDTHVHFRDPGLTQKGDIGTESAAAVAGGVTSFLEMPNTNPPTVSIGAWRAKMERAAAVSCANYAFFVGATNNNFSELEQADFTQVPGIKVFMGSSTGNMLVSESSALEKIFRFAAEKGVVLMAHCESEALIRSNREHFVNLYATEGDLPVAYHQYIRNNEVCYSSSRQAVSMARRYGARLHLAHVSTKEELSLLEDGPLTGKMVTAETCPHYLYIAQDGDAFSWRDGEAALHPALGAAAFKCNPSLKTSADREALLRAAACDLIDTFATDHAPHLPADKQGGALKAASGMPSVQFSLPLLLSCLPAETVVRKYSHNPARLFGVVDRGFIRKGCFADLAIVRPCERWKIGAGDVISRCGWSPYEGVSVGYRVEKTLINGNVAYDCLQNPSAVLSGCQKSITFAG